MDAGSAIDSLSSLSDIWIQGAMTDSQEQLKVQVYDGYEWSDWGVINLESGRLITRSR